MSLRYSFKHELNSYTKCIRRVDLIIKRNAGTHIDIYFVKRKREEKQLFKGEREVTRTKTGHWDLRIDVEYLLKMTKMKKVGI